MAESGHRPIPDPTTLTDERFVREAQHGKEIAALVRELVSAETRHVKELLTALIVENNHRYEDRYLSQQENVTLALAQVSESGRVALVATEKAIDKSELATKEAISKAENATAREFGSLNNKVDAQGAAFTTALQTLETRMAEISAALR